MWLADRASGLILFAFAGFYAVAGWKLDTWAKDAPGPAFMPRILALALAVLGALIWWQAAPEAKGEVEPEYSTREPLLIFLLVLAYVFAMPRLGFPLSSFVLVLALRRLVEPGSWWADVAGAVAAPLSVHLVFVELLGLQFPVYPVWWDQ